MIIDAHNHLGFRYDLGINDIDLLHWMDRAGVDMAVCFSQPVVWDNDYVLDKAKEHPDRLIPFAGVNPWQRSAADELRRCLDRGARGLKLHPVRDSYSLADKVLIDPLFEICAKRRVPILCHGMSEWTNTPWQFYEMAQRFPEVNLIMAHGGHNWLREDAISILKKGNQNLFVDTSVMYGSYVLRCVEEASPERVLMGTDTPAETFEVEMKKMEMWLKNKEHRTLVMGGNIARILEIKS